MNLSNVSGQYNFNYPLSRLTWFKVGGSAEVFFKPLDLNDLKCFIVQNTNVTPITMLGAGSNLIIRDGGVKGAVIKLGNFFSKIELLDDCKISVGSACLNFNLAKFCQLHSIGGLEFLIGIPGTIGGGIFMNAGAYGKEFKDIVLNVEILTKQGDIEIIDNRNIGFSYRSSHLPSGAIITRVIIQGEKSSPDLISETMTNYSNTRKNTQPIKEFTGGSTFSNPPHCKAWKLIDQAGMRGYKIGGASISNMHCNFMINDGTATARDLETLGELVIERVFLNSGIKLHWEIKLIGRHG